LPIFADKGMHLSVLRTWVNRTSAIFLQLDEMCQGVVRLWKKKNTKKFAPEEENSGANKKRGRSKGFGQG
jgi:hypothetical protein